MGITDKMKNAAMSAVINQALSYLEKDPEANLPKLMELVDKVVPGDWYVSQRGAVRKAIREKSNWYQLILKLYDLDPGVRKAFFRNFALNASLFGSATQDETAAREGCNIPWAILMDPTSACNMHCTGCWAAEYGNRLNLSFDELDSIVTQGKQLGTYMYIFTGGEPLVRKKDIVALCEKHADCEFLSFTNGTLIDEEFCREMLRVKNFVPAISLEGFEQANDGRRGDGAFGSAMEAMRLLRSHGLPFGISTCYTSANYADVSSEEYFDQIIDAGALFVWFFHYMPVGAGAVPELLPRAVQAHPRLPPDQGHLQPGFPERRRVCGRLHRRRPPLPAHQRPRRRGALRVHPLLQRQHPGLLAAGCAEEPAVHGLPQQPALQRQHAAALPHAGKPRVPARHGQADRRQEHRLRVAGGCGHPVRPHHPLRPELAARRRRAVERKPRGQGGCPTGRPPGIRPHGPLCPPAAACIRPAALRAPRRQAAGSFCVPHSAAKMQRRPDNGGRRDLRQAQKSPAPQERSCGAGLCVCGAGMPGTHHSMAMVLCSGSFSCAALGSVSFRMPSSNLAWTSAGWMLSPT